MEIGKLVTEQRNPATFNIDQVSTNKLVKLINQEDKKVADAVAQQTEPIALAIDQISKRFKAGGRLIYCGAGTSGRLGVLDAAELVPTFGLTPDKAIGLIAGGKEAMFRAVEGAEDSAELAAEDLKKISLNQKDSVISIASSGRTPYAVGAANFGRKIGSLTIGIICVPPSDSEISKFCDLTIAPIVGPEVITGSTRMKCGTAEKMVLNMISTGVMIKVGKIYQNLMIDVLPSNEKLVNRAIRIIQITTGKDKEQSEELLKEAHNKVPVAIVMGKTGKDFNSATKLLKTNDQNVGKVLNSQKG